MPTSTIVLALLLLLASLSRAEEALWTPVWTKSLPFDPSSRPISAIAGDVFLVQDVYNIVWALDTKTRNITWSMRWDDVSVLLPYPDFDALLVLLEEGAWCVRLSTGERLWANNTVQPKGATVQYGPWFIAPVFDDARVLRLTSYDVRSGAIIWSTPADSLILNGFFAANGLLLIGNGTGGALAFNISSGSLVWANLYGTPIAAYNDLIITIHTQLQTPRSDLYFLDVTTGVPKAVLRNFTSQNTYQQITAIFAYGDVILSDYMTFMARIDMTTLSVKWMTDISTLPETPLGLLYLAPGRTRLWALTNPQTAVPGNFLGNLTGFDAQTGKMVWNVYSPPSVQQPWVVVIRDVLVLPNLIGFTAFSEATGVLRSQNYRTRFPILEGTLQYLSSSEMIGQLPNGSVTVFHF